MVIDTSALIAILLLEEEAAIFAGLMKQAPRRLASAVSISEAGMLMHGRFGKEGANALDSLLVRADIEILPFDAKQTHHAREAFSVYGKGRHPARLNLGDCAAYALAKTTGEPLLFKGSDFTLTDVARCV